METKQENIIDPVDLVPTTTNEATEVAPVEKKPTELVTNEKMEQIFQDALTNIKSDREEISDILAKFLDMVVNDGDASSASKEAVVNLVKAKNEVNDQVIKIAELWTRLKLKTSGVDSAVNRAIHAQQNNIYVGKAEAETSILLDEIEKASTRISRRR